MNAPQGRIKRKPIPPRQPVAGDEGNHFERAVEPLLADCEDLPADAAHPETSSASSTAAADADSTATCQHETAFVIPVAEGLSQAKWNWFRKKPRPLDDFDAFDKASRGPWGSVTLLFRTKGWLVGIFSAVLFVTSIATSTLTQSVVSYPSRNVSIAEEGRARAWKIDHYYQWSTNPIAEARRMEPVTIAIAQAMYTPVAANLSFREPECFATNCTWPRFSTLAMCYNMTDVSDLIKSDSTEFDYGTKLTLPKGVNTTISPDYKTVALPHGPSLVYNDTRYRDASVFNYFAIQADASDEHPRAIEVVFHWCVDTYDASVVNNVVSLERVLSHTEAHYGPSKELRFGTIANVTYLTSPADGGGATKHTAEGMNRTETIRMLQSVMSGTTTYSQRNQFKNGSDVLMHAYISTLKPYEDRYQKENLCDAEKLTDKRKAWWEAVEGMAQKLTNGITNSLLPGTSNVNGTAWQREVYVEIRWQWLALLAMQVVLSVLLLALVIVETVAADVDVVKSSMLAALFAIGAEEKTTLEKDMAEVKPVLPDGQDDHRPVVPAGIAGELRKEAGDKWVLGGSKLDDGGVAATGAVGAAGGNSGNNNNTSSGNNDAEPRYCQEPGCSRTTTTSSTSTATRPSRYCAQHAATCRRQGCSRPRYRKGPYCQEHLHTCRVSRCSNDQAKVLDAWFANSLCLEHQPASTLQAYHHQYYHNADETAPAQSTVVEGAPPQKQQRARRRRKPKAEPREGDDAGPRETRLNLPIVGEHPTTAAAAAEGNVTPPRRKQQDEEEEEEDVPDTPRRSQKTVHFADSTEPLTSAHARHHHHRRRRAAAGEDGRSRASPRTSGHSVTVSQSHAREKRSSAEAKRSRTRVNNNR
ncbi:hypothetical protein CSOJ01_02168 [Colletotrichum sojae]|uniref:Uncharacterized protein n=1 Tax=Colletotrichum sojae TaxID=2175907 RepID=A0A8H6JSH1_9PEZI|nr:hypothetical protein CSOJ01_02168 [Colletotrichum sojae]